MKLFFSVGEPSGDLHGANLIRSLRRRDPNMQCVGYGGPQMEDAGCELHTDLTRFAVMWFARVIVHLPTFWSLYRKAKRYFRQQPPEAVVLIDYPGFNWWIARAAKSCGIPVFYYGTPQMWAWAGWRVRKMRRLVDHVLCKLRFEESWFRQRDCHATYVGHPYFDELATRQLDEQFIERMQGEADRPLVTLLPGSRTQEVTANLPMMLKAIQVVAREAPTARFAIASFSDQQAHLAQQLVDEHVTTDNELNIFTGHTADLIEAATCALAVSGSVSLELLYHATPSVVVYKIGRVPYFAQQFFRKARYITLANLISVERSLDLPAGVYDPHSAIDKAAPMPEYLTCDDKSERIAAHLCEWLHDESSRRRVAQKLAHVRNGVARPGASDRAAVYIVDALSSSQPNRCRTDAAA